MLNGRKFYCTGSLFADWLVVRASLVTTADEQTCASTPKAVAFVPADAVGVTIVDDWDGMGQRTTASGTVTLDAVRVPAEHVVPFTPIFDTVSTYGARANFCTPPSTSVSRRGPGRGRTPSCQGATAFRGGRGERGRGSHADSGRR